MIQDEDVRHVISKHELVENRFIENKLIPTGPIGNNTLQNLTAQPPSQNPSTSHRTEQASLCSSLPTKPGLVLFYRRPIPMKTPVGNDTLHVDWPVLTLPPTWPTLPLSLITSRPSAITTRSKREKIIAETTTLWVPVIVLGDHELQWVERHSLKPCGDVHGKQIGEWRCGGEKSGTDCLSGADVGRKAGVSVRQVLREIALDDACAILAGVWDVGFALRTLVRKEDVLEKM